MKNEKRIGTIFLGINILIALVYFVWRIKYTLPVLTDSFAFAMIFLIAEMVGMLIFWLQLFVIRKKNKDDAFEEKEYSGLDYPHIDVFIVNDGKSKTNAKDTKNACGFLEYPDKNKVHIYEIDGGMDALNNGVKASKSPLIAIIEAGMFPKHEFLEETVAFYLKNVDAGNKVGFIQTSLGAFNADSYQFRLFSRKFVPNKNRLFYKCQEPVFDKNNSVIYCGSGAIFTREALNKIGGFDTKCVLGYVSTGMELQKQGYVCKYLNKTLVSGKFATDISECINEWKVKITDAIEAGKQQKILFSKRFSIRQKINYYAYLTSLAMPFRCTVMLVMPILCSLFGIILFRDKIFEIVLFWLVLYLTANYAMLNITNRVCSIKWDNIRKISTAPFVLMPIIKAFLGINVHAKIKQKKTNVFHKLIYFVPFVVLITLSVIGIAKALIAFRTSGDLLHIVVLLWLFRNIYYELMSILWIIGRPYARQEERVELSVKYVLTDKLNTICGITRDMSMRGVSIWCDKPYDIDNEEIVSIKLDNGKYQADMQGSVIGVEAEGRRWKYIIIFKNMEASRQQYYAILYDRKPEETTKISLAQNMFSDLNRNLGKRFKHKSLEYRRMARIRVNQNVMLSDGEELYIKNYNYKYLLVYSQEKPKDEVTFVPVEGVEIICERFHRFGDHTYMYKVLNYEQLRTDAESRNKIYEWVEQCSIENIIGMVTNSHLVNDTDLAGYF